MRRAFTLIELIVVITILTFVGIFGLTQVSKIYESYIMQKASYELESDANSALEQITSRISQGIKESLVVLDGSYSCVKSLSESSGDSTQTIAWIGADNETLNGLWNGAYNAPGLSDFVDLNSSNGASIVTPSSNFGFANTIISQLANKPSPILQNGFVALYFGQNGLSACNAFFNGAGAMIGVISSNSASSSLNLASSPTFILQYYAASWTAYAIDYSAKDKTLYLKYNFRPWLGDSVNSASSAILARNVSGFGFKNENGLVRVNLCVSKTVGGLPIEVCKEKAVF